MRLLEGLPDADVRRVLSECRRRRFARREVLFHEGDPADSLHLIVKGRIAVRVTTQLGDQATIDVIGPGAAVGELALIPPAAARSATAIALEAAETMMLAASRFAALRAEFPPVTDVLLAVLAERNRTLVGRVAEALYVSAETRVVRRLADVSERWPDSDNDDDGKTVPLTQEDLAGLAGTTRETVNRVLRRLADDGIVELHRGKINIVDFAGLAKRSR